MTETLFFLVAGLILVILGSNILVDGASAIARRFKLSEFIIGLTIVGMGTSAPEMVVSFFGALRGESDIAVGNVIGSNIFNTLLILGVTGLILPIDITRRNRRHDIPVNFLATAIFIGLGMSGTLFGLGQDGLPQWCGGLLLGLFIAYLVYSFFSGQKEEEASGEKDKPLWLASLMTLGGIAALIWGGDRLVDAATQLARELKISEKFIAVTLLAGGTSLPELATCVAAAVKKKGQLALGNIIGSNIFNILLIVGGSALIRPLSFNGITLVDMGVLLVSAVALFTCLFIHRKNQLDRVDGILFVAIWMAYMTYLILHL